MESFDALLQSVRCQPPRAAVATIDSALHLGILRVDEVDELLASLPSRFSVLRPLIDPSAESGIESLVRLILRSLRVPFQTQVVIDGVGRVDFLVDGWLIVECDSLAHHADAAAQRRDRRRDAAAAALGLVTHRILAEEVLFRPDGVRTALIGLLSRGRRGAFRTRRRALSPAPTETRRVS